jgi:hypothetical protein
MKKALAYDCKTLLLHNYLQNGELYIPQNGIKPQIKTKWQVIEHLQ